MILIPPFLINFYFKIGLIKEIYSFFYEMFNKTSYKLSIDFFGKITNFLIQIEK